LSTLEYNPAVPVPETFSGDVVLLKVELHQSGLNGWADGEIIHFTTETDRAAWEKLEMDYGSQHATEVNKRITALGYDLEYENKMCVPCIEANPNKYPEQTANEINIAPEGVKNIVKDSVSADMGPSPLRKLSTEIKNNGSSSSTPINVVTIGQGN
jgi:hypothetical protein